jgi:hypothetical protein
METAVKGVEAAAESEPQTSAEDKAEEEPEITDIKASGPVISNVKSLQPQKITVAVPKELYDMYKSGKITAQELTEKARRVWFNIFR